MSKIVYPIYERFILDRKRIRGPQLVVSIDRLGPPICWKKAGVSLKKSGLNGCKWAVNYCFIACLSNRGRFPCFHSLIKTLGGVGRIRNSYANPRRKQVKENAGFFTSRLQQIFLIHAHISFQPIKTRVWQHITNQNSCNVTAVFPRSHLNTAIDQWEYAYYPNYFIKELGELSIVSMLMEYFLFRNFNTYFQFLLMLDTCLKNTTGDFSTKSIFQVVLSQTSRLKREDWC